MQQRLRRSHSMVALLAAACGSQVAHTPAPAGCRHASVEARPFTLADSSELVGGYHLLLVTTNWPPAHRESRARLRLWSNPPSRRARLAQFGHRKGARPIAGVAEYEDGRNYAGAADQWTAADNPAVELLDSTLYLGSPDPMDAVFTSLHIEQIARGGFWGRFDGSEGFSIVIDSAGRQLPPSAGYFCALRLD